MSLEKSRGLQVRATGAGISPTSATVAENAPIGTPVMHLTTNVPGAAITLDGGPFTKDGGDNLALSVAAGADGTVQTAMVSATRPAAGDVPYLKITQGIPVTARAVVVAPPASNPFYTAAQRVIASQATPYNVQVDPSPPTVNILTSASNSPVSGRAFSAGGATATTAVPDGYSGTMNGGTSKWVITKPSGAKTHTPGNYKAFNYGGRQLAWKMDATSSQYCSIWTSYDHGVTFLRHAIEPAHWTASGWTHVDYGSYADRLILVITEHESMATYGWDFEAGYPITPWASDELNIQVEGDSWVYSQTDNSGVATYGQTFQVGLLLGSLGTKNGGFRTNGFVQTQAGVQCNYHDRLVHPAGPEASLWGPAVDLGIIPASINDNAFSSTVRAAVADAWAAYRAANPNTPVFMPIGIYPPDYNENPATILAEIQGFCDVFGYTQAERDANGAHYKDFSCASGSALIPRGATGSSTWFSIIDPPHPSRVGHNGIAGVWRDEIMPLMGRIVARGSGSGGAPLIPDYAILDQDGTAILDRDGTAILSQP